MRPSPKRKDRPLTLKKALFTALLGILLLCSFWIAESAYKVRLPESDSPATLYSNQTQDDLSQTYITAISHAKQSVLLIIYSLTDPKIINSLKQKSEEGVDVRIICDAKASPYIDRKIGDKVTLTKRFGHGLMHQKILVIDQCETWIGSANMTTESLRMHGNLVAAMNSPLLGATVLAKADSLKDYERTELFKHQDFQIGGQQVELWFFPDNPDGVEKIKSLIRSAKKTVSVAMFTWTRLDLANEVIAASKRGVKAEVILDRTSAKGASSKVASALKKAGIPISCNQGASLLHHKFLYVDSKTLLTGSANWTKAAFTQNDDCFIILHDLTEDQKGHMDKLWDVIKSESISINERNRK